MGAVLRVFRQIAHDDALIVVKQRPRNALDVGDRYTLHGGEGRMAAGAPADPGLRLRIAEPLAVRAELAQVRRAGEAT